MATKFSKIMKFRDNSADDIRYDSLGDDEKSLVEQPEAELVYYKKEWRSRATITYSLTLILLLISVTLNVIGWRELSTLRPLVPVEEFDSPVVRDLGTQYHSQFMNGSFVKKNIYRGKASQEVDDAWLALGTNDGSFIIAEEEGARFGLQSGQVKRIDEQGGGYVADLFVFHHLHCLNLMRQTSHFSWDYYRAKAGTDEAPTTAFEAFESEELVETHYTHCLDMLRQVIMCNADTNLYTQWWVKDVGPVMNFSYNMQCKNFDAIRQWYKERHLDIDHTYVQVMPGDTVFDEPF